MTRDATYSYRLDESEYSSGSLCSHLPRSALYSLLRTCIAVGIAPECTYPAYPILLRMAVVLSLPHPRVAPIPFARFSSFRSTSWSRSTSPRTSYCAGGPDVLHVVIWPTSVGSQSPSESVSAPGRQFGTPYGIGRADALSVKNWNRFPGEDSTLLFALPPKGARMHLRNDLSRVRKSLDAYIAHKQARGF